MPKAPSSQIVRTIGKIRDVVELPHPPRPGRDGDDQPADIEHGERNHLAPRERVADAAIQRIRTVLGKTDDVGAGLDAGQSAAQPGDSRADQDRAKPERHARVEAMLEQVERQRPWSNEEDPDPDRPVGEPVADLDAFEDRTIVRQFDPLGVAEGALVRGGQDAAPRRARLLLVSRRCRHK
jgi:hypothetical protein